MVRSIAFLALFIGQEGRLPVPSDDAVRQAEKTIREIFKEELAVRTPAAQLKLARKYLDQGKETKDDDAARFVLFRDAADLAGRAGDVDLLVRALDELGNAYQVDLLALKESSFTKVAPTLAKPEDAAKLANAGLQLAGAAMDTERFDLALRSAQSAVAAARKSKEITLVVRADATTKSVAETKAAFEKSAQAEPVLVATPDDPAANLARGEYLCLFRGDWERGLVFLSKGSDPALKSLAQKELKSPSDALPIADEWYDQAQKEKSPLRKSQMAARARVLYEQALSGAAGLAKAKIEKRLAELSKSKPEPGSSAKPALPGLVGSWAFEEGAGTAARDQSGRGNQGTLTSIAWTTRGSGRAIGFDGKDSFVAFATAGLPDLRAPKTVAFHYYTDSIPGPSIPEAQIILAFLGEGDPPSAGLAIGFWQSRIRLWSYGGAVLGEAPPPAPKSWHHFAYAYDGTEGRIYLDGVLQGTSKANLPSGAVKHFALGRWSIHNRKQFFNGSLDELRIFDRALGESEIKSLSN